MPKPVMHNHSKTPERIPAAGKREHPALRRTLVGAAAPAAQLLSCEAIELLSRAKKPKTF